MSLPPGSLAYLGEEVWMQRVRAALEARSTCASDAMLLEGQSSRAYLKFGPLSGKHRLRHALRSLLPGQDLPRLQEFKNLQWLREHGFGAPRPLCAGALRRGGLPCFQFLATELIPDAKDLRTLEPRVSELPATEQLFALLGREVGRLHRLGFVHRDLYPRNILGSHAEGGWRIDFIDAWRGGVGRGLRGPDYDLACLLLFAPLLFHEEQTRVLLGSYFDELSERPSARWKQRVTGIRRLLLRQLSAKGRLRHALPPADWQLPI